MLEFFKRFMKEEEGQDSGGICPAVGFPGVGGDRNPADFGQCGQQGVQ